MSLLYELIRSFWLPYHLPLLSCGVRLPLEGMLLVRWPYLMTHSWAPVGDSLYSHFIWVMTCSCPLPHSNIIWLSDTLGKCQPPFPTPRHTLYILIHSLHELFATLWRRQSHFRHAHSVDALLSSLRSLLLVIITKRVLIIVSLFGTHLCLYILALGGACILTLCLHPKSSVWLKPLLLPPYLLYLLTLWLLTSPLPFATGSTPPH